MVEKSSKELIEEGFLETIKVIPDQLIFKRVIWYNITLSEQETK